MLVWIMFKYGRPSFTFSKVLNMWKSISFDNTWINMFLAWGMANCLWKKMKLLWWEIGWDKGRGGVTLNTMFVMCLFDQRSSLLSYITKIYTIYIFFPKYILQSYFVLTFIEMLYITVFILFHPQTWEMDIFYILMSNFTPK